MNFVRRPSGGSADLSATAAAGPATQAKARANIKARGGNRPLRRTLGKLYSQAAGSATTHSVMLLGDSLGFRPWLYGMDRIFRGICGWRSGVCGSPSGYFGPEHALEGSAVVTTGAFTTWMDGSFWTIPSGSAVRFYKSGALFRCNQFKVYYLKEPGAGTFKIQSSTTAIGSGFADEAGFTSISADDTLGLGIATVSKADGTYALRIEALSGTVKILAVGFDLTGLNGVNFTDVTRGGLGLQQSSTAPQAIMEAFFADRGVDFLTFICDDSLAVVEAGWPTVEGWLNTACPRADKLVFGNGPKAEVNGGDAASQAQCDYFRARLEGVDRWHFVDGMEVLGSYAEVEALGWHGDGLHLDERAYAALAGVAAERVGLLEMPQVRSPFPIASFDNTRRSILSSLNIALSESPHLLSADGLAGRIEADPQFGYDIFCRLVRALRGRTMSGTSDAWRLSSSEAALRSFLPSGIGISADNVAGLYYRASGTPEGVLTATPGSLCVVGAGGAGTTLYVKESGTGNTGWVAK